LPVRVRQRRPRISCIAILVGAALILAAPAQAHFPATADLTVPPGGVGWIGSPDIPPQMTVMDAYVKAQNEKDENGNVILKLAVLLGKAPNKHARFVTCGAIAGDVLGNAVATGDEEAFTLGLLFLKLCTTIARVMPADKPTISAAATNCNMVRKTAGIKITRKGKNWHGHITSNPSKSPKSPVLVTCKRQAGGYKITVRPRSRTKKLRQVVGPTFGIGVVSDSKQSDKVTTTFKVR
jgi:hypothetical protein